MALRSFTNRRFSAYSYDTIRTFLCRSYSSVPSDNEVLPETSGLSGEEVKKGGFARAFEKYTQVEQEDTEVPVGPPKTFASLLRNSKLMQVI